MWRLVSTVIWFVGSTPISWYRKNYVATKTSSYSTDLCKDLLAMEESIGMGYMLRSLDIPLKGPTDICGENLVMIIYNTNMNSDLKKKHVEISYNNLWYSAAAGIVKPIKVCTLIN